MTNANEAKAMTVLANGGYFRKALERSYFGSEKFATHLYDRAGRRVAGFGPAARRELSAVLTDSVLEGYSTHGERWFMDATVAALWKM